MDYSYKITIKLNVINIENINLAFRFKHNLLPNDIMELFTININKYNTHNMNNMTIIINPFHVISVYPCLLSIIFRLPSSYHYFVLFLLWYIFNHFIYSTSLFFNRSTKDSYTSIIFVCRYVCILLAYLGFTYWMGGTH